MEMLVAPLVWNDSNQMVADTFRFFLQDGGIRELHMLKHAFLSQNVWEESSFNQIKGESMYIYFADNEPEHMWVYPQALCLYYMEDKDSALIGVYRASAEKMKVLFDSSQLSEIVFYHKIKGDFGPEGKGEARYLPGFNWLRAFRPESREDVMVHDNYVPAVIKEESEEIDDEE